MSVNFRVTLSLPLQVVAAIKNRGNNTNGVAGLNSALVGSTQAVLAAVDALPYNISAPEQTTAAPLRKGE